MTKSNYCKKKADLAEYDWFAPEVTLNFEGKSKFGTSFGGAVTIMTVLLFVFIVY